MAWPRSGSIRSVGAPSRAILAPPIQPAHCLDQALFWRVLLPVSAGRVEEHDFCRRRENGRLDAFAAE
jgi:hypothetical protein